MRDPHYRHHLTELRGRIPWVRSLLPDSPRYKLWLGDLVEFVHAAYGPSSPQMEALAAAIQQFRPSPDADEAGRQQAYLARLDAVEGLLAQWEAAAGS